ncbi:kinase-like protein, partial [Xylona heveae TC161]
MPVAYDFVNRGSAPNPGALCLEDKFEVLKDIGDGSFGSVVLARTRSAGAHVARRGTLVAIKTMKKTFESFSPCLELREVIFLRTLPAHVHLVPALDIFLDPLSKKLHIAMEYMDGNLYQLMKSRDHKCFDGATVKSILFQILGGLEHIHAHNFFHRDIKPENILVSTSAPQEAGATFRRYSALITPPSTPPMYTVKIADFGLARETQSRLPYTTYVSTRWYRAPEVLLRAGEYSAPVDIWAMGAMAVEIATLKPLFPGSNEVDQVWRVCEIMGSPGNWYNKAGQRVGGGEWRDGTRLAQKLGFAFPKMAPHSMDTIIQPPQWPPALAHFVSWCLMWDPKNRPTSTQALAHEYFADAVDPLRPKSSASRILNRKHSDISHRSSRDLGDYSPTLPSKPSWFRKSLIIRDQPNAASQQPTVAQHAAARPVPVHSVSTEHASSPKARPHPSKRATWTNGVSSKAAPIPILPSIKPISPMPDGTTAQANGRTVKGAPAGDNRRIVFDDRAAKKIGRQLSVASYNNNNNSNYTEACRQDAERALNGSGAITPPVAPKESFFSHLRKRARRLSGRHQLPLSPNADDIEASAGCAPWSNRSSINFDRTPMVSPAHKNDYSEAEKALQSGRNSIDASRSPSIGYPGGVLRQPGGGSGSNTPVRRQPSLRSQRESVDNLAAAATNPGSLVTRPRRALQASTSPMQRYETPDEEEELLDEVLASARQAVKRLDIRDDHKVSNKENEPRGLHATYVNPYPTPSHSAKRDSKFGQVALDTPSKPFDLGHIGGTTQRGSHLATPPYEEHEWGAAAAA